MALEKEKHMDILYNQLLLTIPGSTAYEKKARVMKNEKYISLVQQQLTAHAKYKLVASALREVLLHGEPRNQP